MPNASQECLAILLARLVSPVGLEAFTKLFPGVLAYSLRVTGFRLNNFMSRCHYGKIIIFLDT